MANKRPVKVSADPQAFFERTATTEATFRVWQEHMSRMSSETIELSAGHRTTIDWRRRVERLRTLSFNDVVDLLSPSAVCPPRFGREFVWDQLPASGVSSRGLLELRHATRALGDAVPKEAAPSTRTTARADEPDEGYCSPDPGECSCKQVRTDNSTLLQCEQCNRWYHMDCAGFSSTKDIPEVYHCRACARKDAAVTKKRKRAEAAAAAAASAATAASAAKVARSSASASGTAQPSKRPKVRRRCTVCRGQVSASERKGPAPRIFKCRICRGFTHFSCAKHKPKDGVRHCPACRKAQRKTSLDLLADAVDQKEKGGKTKLSPRSSKAATASGESPFGWNFFAAAQPPNSAHPYAAYTATRVQPSSSASSDTPAQKETPELLKKILKTETSSNGTPQPAASNAQPTSLSMKTSTASAAASAFAARALTPAPKPLAAASSTGGVWSLSPTESVPPPAPRKGSADSSTSAATASGEREHLGSSAEKGAVSNVVNLLAEDSDSEGAHPRGDQNASARGHSGRTGGQQAAKTHADGAAASSSAAQRDRNNILDDILRAGDRSPAVPMYSSPQMYGVQAARQAHPPGAGSPPMHAGHPDASGGAHSVPAWQPVYATSPQYLGVGGVPVPPHYMPSVQHSVAQSYMNRRY